ncbi:hypothetical membrane protein [Corynebacterium kutscheri]|uniref:divisome protein SepX/GlpR n=1 Tax=Corynebacterium kutscheri TaxID=35755 RepID=UPI000F6BF20B|nr:gephyrin-like molybdotransferase receptor GlpR [Corynebacterium kutscheri]VEH80237.1 hypothetical membrane protein [Corynebacterium kutscheri]
MTSALIIGLIIVVWLFVLAPWLLRSQRPIRKAGDGFDETHVVFAGGSKTPVHAPRPRLRPRLERQNSDEELAFEDQADQAEEEILVDDAPEHDFESVINAAKEKISLRRVESDRNQQLVEEIIDGDIVEELPVAHYDEETTEVENDYALDYDDYDEVAGYYHYDDAYASPEDLMYSDTEDTVDEEQTTAVAVDPAVAEEAVELNDELTDEEFDFAQSRRGAWKPEIERAARLERNRRRMRTLIGLGVTVVATIITAVFVGGWSWFAAALALLLTGMYMYALRKQVVAEEKLHRRRVQMLRRAALGVRTAYDDDLGIPQRLRHPGAVVLEVDDESPDFEELDMVSYTDDGIDDDYDEIGTRRVG